ncbi:MAG: prolyl oligopeptidase family serine peptidase [Candidatus Pacebacteria bacterium]|nr:prolyl oligopeptidase family serine peptidase [Candidatus Paceibacterota bacterium]
MIFPESRKENTNEEIGGRVVADPYRWLEDAGQPEVRQWIAQQNEYADLQLRDPRQKAFAEELVKDFEVTTFSNPLYVNGRYFYMERRPGEDQMALYVRYGLEGEPIKLIDPNGRKEGNTVSLDYWVPHHEGNLIAYGLSEGGDEMATLRVFDVQRKTDLPDEIVRCRHSSICWLPDGSGFFYTRNPRPGTVPQNEEHLHVKVYLHELGSDPGSDELIFGEGRPKDDMISLSLSLDGQYLTIDVSRTWTENEVYLYDADKKTTKPLVAGIPAQFSPRFLADKVLMFTNYHANNYRILSAPLEEIYKPIEQWKEFVPEKEHVLSFVDVTKDKILLGYLVNACARVIVLDHDNKETGTIPLPEYASMEGVTGMETESEFSYGVESFAFPWISYRYDTVADAYSVYRKTESPIDPDQYETTQEWFVSKDGTKVPMFIFHKKGLTLGAVPTILYAYGGFGSNQEPSFMRNWIPWVAHGGIFAVANIRGGGEFGEKWHLDGIKDKKQNSFDDFIAAAEYLIAQKYTDREHLGILGGSNGGLLVSAVEVQRPDLFKAACARVPLTDMVRFPKFGMALRWVHEYGDPSDPADLARILMWSPYHNVKNGTEYPAMLFMVGDRDSRVDPLHARKMAAMLQSTNKKNPVFVHTEIDAGHGAGKPISKVVDAQSLILAFFGNELELL